MRGGRTLGYTVMPVEAGRVRSRHFSHIGLKTLNLPPRATDSGTREVHKGPDMILGTPDTQKVDTLRLQEKDIGVLLSYLDAQSKAKDKGTRKFERFTYREVTAIVLTIEQFDSSQRSYLVRPRNLSEGGLGFIHGTFVYPGSKAVVTLMNREKQQVSIPGKIVRCRHVRAHIHEVGMKFDEPLDLTKYMALGE